IVVSAGGGPAFAIAVASQGKSPELSVSGIVLGRVDGGSQAGASEAGGESTARNNVRGGPQMQSGDGFRVIGLVEVGAVVNAGEAGDEGYGDQRGEGRGDAEDHSAKARFHRFGTMNNTPRI